MSKLITITKRFINECWLANYSSECINETLSINCLHQKTIGRCTGIDTFRLDCDDWGRAFPDYGTHIINIKEYPNLVIADVIRFGTHQYQYESTNKNDLLKPSQFLTGILNLKPTGIRYTLPAKIFYMFENEKITQIIIDEDPMEMCYTLGIHTDQKEPLSTSIKYDYIRNSISILCKEPLTIRELQTLALLFCALSAKHIAEFFNVSYRTIEKFTHSAYNKFGVTNKQTLLELMYENCLLTLWLDLGKQLILQQQLNKKGLISYD